MRFISAAVIKSLVTYLLEGEAQTIITQMLKKIMMKTATPPVTINRSFWYWGTMREVNRYATASHIRIIGSMVSPRIAFYSLYHPSRLCWIRGTLVYKSSKHMQKWTKVEKVTIKIVNKFYLQHMTMLSLPGMAFARFGLINPAASNAKPQKRCSTPTTGTQQ